MINKIQNKNKFFILIVIIGCIFRWDGISSGYWYDEWSSFYYSNPNLTISQIFNITIVEEGAQPFYFIVASKWNYLFGYSPETLRYFSFFLGSVSIILFIILLKEFSKKNTFLFFSAILFSCNYFLIQYSQESRFYSLSLFFSILNLIFFFRFIKKQKYIYSYIFFSILSLLTNIFFVLLIFSQIIYLIINKKKIIYLISTIISLFSWCIIDYKYITSIFEKSLHNFYIADTINLHFLIGYYFNIYFGSIFLGGFILIICFFYLRNIKKIINSNIFYLITSIFITYAIPIIYSLLKNPILRPRYIIFIVPIIIIYFSYVIFKLKKKVTKNIIMVTVVSFSLIIATQSKQIIPKPDTEAAIKLIISSDTSFLLIKSDQKLFKNYLINLSLAKDKIDFINSNEILNKDAFWSICLNNPRFATNSRADDKNCLSNSHYKSHVIADIKKVPDYILVLYKKN